MSRQCNRLDRFWMDQDVKYDFTADLTGTGDRSVNVITETYISVIEIWTKRCSHLHPLQLVELSWVCSPLPYHNYWATGVHRAGGFVTCYLVTSWLLWRDAWRVDRVTSWLVPLYTQPIIKYTANLLMGAQIHSRQLHAAIRVSEENHGIRSCV